MEHGSGEGHARVGYDTSRPFGSFVEIVRNVLLHPARFFVELGGPTESVKAPILFSVVCAYVSFPLAVIAATFDPLFRQDNPFDPFSVGRLLETAESNPLAAVGLVALGLALIGLFAVLGLYVGTAIQHFFVWIFVRRRNGYWGTFPVIAYSSALTLFTWIPILGYVVSLYSIYLYAVGIRQMHGTTTLRAFLAAGVPLLLSFASTTFTLYMTYVAA